MEEPDFLFGGIGRHRAEAEELVDRDAQCLSYLFDVNQGDIALSALNAADIAAVEAGLVGQGHLGGDALLLAHLSDALSEFS